MKVFRFLAALSVSMMLAATAGAQSKHAPSSEYPSYEGLVMAGYQGWFHNRERGEMYTNPDDIRIDMWPDVSEYELTYPTAYRHADGSVARFFCSDDPSTVRTHFKWMKQYGLDGVFVQRFFGNAMPRRDGSHEATVLGHSLKYAQEYHRSLAVMYDLSGLNPGKDDCMKLVEDWKYLVDSLKVTSYGKQNMYLYHNGKPLVVIWGVGFPDRPYDIRDIKLAEFMDFLHNDPVYGGCSVMLGVPTYWRTLEYDSVEDPYLHELIRQCDIVLPWMVQRFSPLVHFDMDRYRDVIRKDIAWCKEAGVDYVPLIYPGFSWHNLSVHAAGDVIGAVKPVASIPRQGGTFYWDQAYTAIKAGAKMLYVAMFDEVNEGTAIFKVTDNPPVSKSAQFADMDGKPSDHYLFLTGEIAKMLRGEKALDKQMPKAALITTPEGVISRPIEDGMTANPFITHLYTADPSAHVWADGRLYVYASHDMDPPRGCDLMDKYHIFSTDDLVNWTDHGQILEAADVPWGRPEGGFMWAPDCAYRNGKYYYYFPHPSESRWNDSWKIGVAISKKPASDFKVQKKYIKNVPPHIDPCVFIDDDGQAYMYVGGSAKCYGGKLKKNMVELDGEMVRMEGLEDFHEGTWVYKYNGNYYLVYPDNYIENGVQLNRMHYAMSKNPLGPWDYKGIFLDRTDCDTMHGSVVEFKGQWYVFYHGCQISQMGNLRSICFDKLFYNPDGTIQMVKQRGHSDLPRK